MIFLNDSRNTGVKRAKTDHLPSKMVSCAHSYVDGMWFEYTRVWVKILSRGEFSPNFCSQPSFYMCKQTTYPLMVFDHKKIDVKPIFTVPDMMSNLASISGTVEMSAASTLLGLNTSACYCLLFVGIILIRPCNFGSKLWVKPFF